MERFMCRMTWMLLSYEMIEQIIELRNKFPEYMHQIPQ